MVSYNVVGLAVGLMGMAMSGVGVSAQQCAGNPGSTCMTSKGSWISIINPVQGQSVASGSTLTLSWSACPTGGDPTFLNSNITFSIVDASNPNNAADLPNNEGVLPGSYAVSALTANIPLPSTIPAGAKYAVKSIYKDTNEFKYCYGVTFAITGGAAPAASTGAAAPAATTGGSAAGPTGAASVGPTGGAASTGGSAAAAVTSSKSGALELAVVGGLSIVAAALMF